ncbi:DUF7352 domain-containing protein [Rhodococcoides fascians]|uniref:DUF7352 domain-containing protein n=1 Tax=Rhodococcoides fascians TaxID=1828 RepID=UPI0037AFF986
MKPLREGVIHRMELPIADVFDIAIPGFRQVLHVSEHRNHARSREAFEVWYERAASATTADTVTVRFRTVGTGNPITFRTGPTYAQYLGTVKTHSNQLVWHVYVEYPVVEEV